MRWLWAWQATRPLASAVGPPSPTDEVVGLEPRHRSVAVGHLAAPSGPYHQHVAQVAGEAPHRPPQVEDLALAVEDDAAQHAPHDGGHGQAGMQRGPVEQLAPSIHRGVIQRQTGPIETGGWCSSSAVDRDVGEVVVVAGSGQHILGHRLAHHHVHHRHRRAGAGTCSAGRDETDQRVGSALRHGALSHGALRRRVVGLGAPQPLALRRQRARHDATGQRVEQERAPHHPVTLTPPPHTPTPHLHSRLGAVGIGGQRPVPHHPTELGEAQRLGLFHQPPLPLHHRRTGTPILHAAQHRHVRLGQHPRLERRLEHVETGQPPPHPPIGTHHPGIGVAVTSRQRRRGDKPLGARNAPLLHHPRRPTRQRLHPRPQALHPAQPPSQPVVAHRRQIQGHRPIQHGVQLALHRHHLVLDHLTPSIRPLTEQHRTTPNNIEHIDRL